jgi:quinol monooxygenase YgiN
VRLQERQMALVVHNELFIKPERVDDFWSFLTPDKTRAFPGCLSFIILEDPEQPGRVLFMQTWTSQEDLERYRRSRASDGSRQQLRALYAKPPVTSYWQISER